jgi:hypothetical protein
MLIAFHGCAFLLLVSPSDVVCDGLLDFAESLYGGGATMLTPRQLKNAQDLQTSFSSLLTAAEQLREAVKKGDPEAAAVAMQVPRSTYSEAAPLSGEDVLLQAELPSAFNTSRWNSPVKSQGTTTMSASYAAVAAAEAAYIALDLAAKGVTWWDQLAVPDDSANEEGCRL